MEDPKISQEKIQEMVDKLNNESEPGKQGWFAANGYNALTSFSFGPDGKSPTFHPSSGIVVKVFINAATGELRVFPPALFGKINHD